MGEKLINPIYNVYKKYRQMNLVNPYRFGVSWNIGNIVLVRYITTYPDGSGRKTGVYFKPDGSRFYATSDLHQLYQFNLTIPWDISSLASSYTSSQVENNTGMTLKSDGTKVYLVNVTTNLIRAFNLTTPWDVSVKTVAETTSIPANSRGIEFSSSGTLLFVNTLTSIYSYSLSTPWNVSTKTLVFTKDLSADGTDFRDIRISPDGVNFYLPSENFTIKQYKASTAWDISTLTLFKTESRTGITAIQGLWFRNDGKKLYVTANNIANMMQEWNWG